MRVRHISSGFVLPRQEPRSRLGRAFCLKFRVYESRLGCVGRACFCDYFGNNRPMKVDMELYLL